MMLFDAVDATSARLTKDGYLVADARVARTGIQRYFAGELGLDGDPARIVNVYRPPEQVFAADALASYAHRPVTVDHPADMVDASNWKDHAAGQTGDEVLRDGEYVRVPILLMDQAAIDDWKNGKRELSMGYTMDLQLTDGEVDGQPYEAVQTNLRMNHLALVSRARGGSQLRLGDAQPEVNSMDLKTITVDGLPIETTPAGAQAVEKLKNELNDARTAAEAERTAHAKALAGKDAELATKDAEIDDLKGKILSDEDLDQRVAARADLIATAKRVADKDYVGLSDSDIKRKAVIAVLGADAVEGKSDEYIGVRFDILAEDAEQDGVRRVMRMGDLRPTDETATAYDEMKSGLADAWKTGGIQ